MLLTLCTLIFLVRSTVLLSKSCFVSYGINGKLLAWIGAFLNNRSQCVVIDQCYSSVSSVLSGVPQGSVLGPILFLIFYIKLYSRIDIYQSPIFLQHSLDRLSSWADSWQLPVAINISKCCVVSTCVNKAVLIVTSTI
jgi:Reverse transcriptase (RNA-dependent DNA polymerase)